MGGVPFYDVVVRESAPKGKSRVTTVKVNKKPLPLGSAMSVGAYYVDNSSARSFKLVASKKKGVAGIEVSPDLSKFRQPKGKTRIPKGFYVEKTMYLIDTPGELQGITARGLLARQRKNRGGFL